MLVRVKVLLFFLKPGKRNFSYGYGVLAIPRSSEREMLVGVMVSWLFNKSRKRDVSFS